MNRRALSCCSKWGIVVALFACGLAACQHRPVRELRAASRRLADDVAGRRGDDIVAAVVPGKRNAVDLGRLTGEDRKAWSKALRNPMAVHPEALVLVAPDWPTRVSYGKDGWMLAEDPLDLYTQDTPRAALRALVYSSRLERWDVLLELAPRRYRIGLSVDDLERAWTQGEHAAALAAARDEVAAHLFDPILADEHEAVLELGAGHVARLEREGTRWVVVDFLPARPAIEH